MYIGNEKTRRLWKEIKPWLKGAALREDAPDDVKRKFEDWKMEMNAEEERQIYLLNHGE
jgi:hypothetical protein